jgi:hypothetical protein
MNNVKNKDIIIIIILGSILCCNQSGDDPQGDLARFGY